MPIETLELHEEACVRIIAVDHADGIVGIEGADKIAIDGLDGFHMARRHEASRSDQGETG